MRLSQLSILLLIITLSSCQLIPQKEKESNKSNDGTRVIKSYYEKSGALKSEITVKDNKKHGPAKKYYATGELHTLVNYNNGIKEGETYWYYKNGQPYRVTPYKNGKMHGIRKKYYEDGQLQAEIPYEDGELVEGTKEFKKNGDLISEDVKIIFETVNELKYENKYILKIKLSEKQSDVEFFEEKTSVEGNKVMVPVKVNQSGTGKIEYSIPLGGSKITVLKIFAKYKTRLGNPVLISTSYNLVVENR